MPYAAADARRQLLDDLAAVVDELGIAVTALGEAYEALDEATGDRLEAELFGPVQAAYGRARRTHSEFSARHGLPARSFSPQPSGARPRDARGAIDRAVTLAGQADHELAELQDSMLPVEVGDPELRAGLSEVRRLIGRGTGAARELGRTLGR